MICRAVFSPQYTRRYTIVQRFLLILLLFTLIILILKTKTLVKEKDLKIFITLITF